MSAAIQPTGTTADPVPTAAASGALDWVVDTLWGVPSGVHVSAEKRPADGCAVESFAVLPSAARPRLLVPLGSRRAASHALREYTPGKKGVRLVKPLLTLGVRAGLAQPLLRDRVHVGVSEDVPSGALADMLLTEHLQQVFGRRDLQLAVKFDAPRPQRKPILQILSRDGTPLGFGKVGWNDLTRALIVNEARALERFRAGVTPVREFDVPALIHAGPWRDLEILIVAPVSFGARRRFLERPPVAATAEAGEMAASERTALSQSDYWLRARRRIERTRSLSPTAPAARLHAVAEDVEDRYGDIVLDFGSWHGDWVPWNMGCRAGRLYVWDWERSGELAPRGLDGIHFEYQAELGLRKTQPIPALAVTLQRGAALLSALGVPPAHAGPLLALHLLEMSLRFDEARLAGVETGDPKYLPALHALLASQPSRQIDGAG